MMRYFLCALLFSSGCGESGEITTNSWKCSTQGELCHERVSNQTNPDGTDYEGPQGTQGLPGTDGRAGTNGTDGATGPMGPSGQNGQTVIGPQGPSGAPGTPGSDGAPGLPCTVEPGTGGALVRCPDGSSVFISNGLNGLNGTNGHNGTDGQNAPPTVYTVVGLVDPCGDAPGIYDEVFLRLQNGTLIASFSDNSNGQNTRFSVIGQGSYVTTDGSNCYFSVDSNLALYNEHY